MIIGLILASGAFALIAWLTFNLSIYALPLFIGVSAASLAHRTGAGLAGSAILGLIAGAMTFGVGQAAFGVARSIFSTRVIGGDLYNSSGRCWLLLDAAHRRALRSKCRVAGSILAPRRFRLWIGRVQAFGGVRAAAGSRAESDSVF